jgi:hypothetical protein
LHPCLLIHHSHFCLCGLGHLFHFFHLVFFSSFTIFLKISLNR